MRWQAYCVHSCDGSAFGGSKQPLGGAAQRSPACVTLHGSLRPEARAEFDEGAVDPALRIGPVILTFKRTSQQQAEIDALLRDQQDPSSPNYHKWLTPEDYGKRFGLPGADVSSIMDPVARPEAGGHGARAELDCVQRRGGQIAAALHTEIHRYSVDGKQHFANATEASIPAALEAVAEGFMGLDDFGLHPRQPGWDVHAVHHRRRSGFAPACHKRDAGSLDAIQ